MPQLQKGLNCLLPPDVVVAGAVEAAPEFHARFDATAAHVLVYYHEHARAFAVLPALCLAYQETARP